MKDCNNRNRKFRVILKSTITFNKYRTKFLNATFLKFQFAICRLPTLIPASKLAVRRNMDSTIKRPTVWDKFLIQPLNSSFNIHLLYLFKNSIQNQCYYKNVVQVILFTCTKNNVLTRRAYAVIALQSPRLL